MKRIRGRCTIWWNLVALAMVTVATTACVSVRPLQMSYEPPKDPKRTQNSRVICLVDIVDETEKDSDYPNYVGADFAPAGNRVYVWTMQTDISSYVKKSLSSYLSAMGYEIFAVGGTGPHADIPADAIRITGNVKKFFVTDKSVMMPLPFAPAAHNLSVESEIALQVTDAGGKVLLDIESQIQGTASAGTVHALIFAVTGTTGVDTLDMQVASLLNVTLTDVSRKICSLLKSMGR